MINFIPFLFLSICSSVIADIGVLDIEYPSVKITAPAPNGSVILQSGVNLGDLFLIPGPGGDVFFENENITDIIEIARSLPPVWSAHAHVGFFGTFSGGQKINIKLEAEDPEGGNLRFMVVAGVLPPGIHLNDTTGYLTGIAPDEDALYSFTIRAIDKRNKYADAVFKMETRERNHCDSNPCKHGSDCINTKGWYYCNCTGIDGGENCQYDCRSHTIGVSDRNKIPDSQMSAYLSQTTYLASNGRYASGSYGWCGTNGNSWLQVDMGNITTVYKVLMQGYTSRYYTSRYTLSFSRDGNNFMAVNTTSGSTQCKCKFIGKNKYTTSASGGSIHQIPSHILLFVVLPMYARGNLRLSCLQRRLLVVSD